jgi:hypothetical protein
VLNIQNISKDSKIIKKKLKETTFASKDRIHSEKVRHAARCTWDSLIILTIESLAPRDVVSFAVEGGYNWAVVEVDCVEFVYIFKKEQKANQVAHCCAKFAVVNGEHATWETEPPPG